MTRETTTAAKAGNAPPRGHWRQLGHLWQAPTFLLGLLACLGVAAARPLWYVGPGRALDQTLTRARHLLDLPRPDLDEVQTLANRALTELPPDSPRVGEAHFLLGSAALRRAEQTPAAAVEFWQKALAGLEQAETLGVPETDRRKLAYRLGKVYAALEADPRRIVDHLVEALPDGADDPFEGYGLLAKAYLRLTPPERGKALEATQQQLALPSADEAVLAGPRLLCGKLLLEMKQVEEASRVLARIGPGAPADVQAQSLSLRARILTDDGAWAEAALLWEELRNDRQASAEPGRVLYNLGLCYRNMDQKGKAMRVWEEAVRLGGEEGQAAALQLAELRLSGDNVATAYEAFEAGLNGVAAPRDYHNSLFPLDKACRLFEEGCRGYRQMGRYEASQRLARLYEKLAPDGGAQELAGLAGEAWARSLLEEAQHAPTLGGGLRQEAEEAFKKFQEAGKAFETAAALSNNPTDRAEWFWRSAENYRQGADAVSAVRVLDSYVRLPVSAERQGEAWFALGEAHRAQRHDVLAEESYKRCIQYPGPFAFRARCQLAATASAQGREDDAEAMLNQNLELLTSSVTPDPEAHEKTLTALASLLFERRNYRDAFVRLQEAIQRYPENPNALKLRTQFAECCRFLADQYGLQISRNHSGTEAELGHYRKQQLRFLDMAATNYLKLADDLAARQAERPLAPDEERALRTAAFGVADCRFEEGQFDDALRQYEILTGRYRNQVDGLIALRNVWRCYGVKLQGEKARATLERIRAALREMPPGAFDAEPEVRTRRWWDEWLSQQGRQGL
jgi:Tfp pilus assembly protein PilF